MDTGLRRYRSSFALEQCGHLEGGRFCSRWYRGLGEDMEWLRLSLDGPEAPHVRVYTCQIPPAAFDWAGSAPALEGNSCDLLLYGVRGRYLAFTVEPGNALQGFSLTFPGRSITEGLPSVLQGDDTLRALLAVYQSGYMDLNRDIRDFPRRLDPAQPDAVPHLSRWLGALRWSSDPVVAQTLLPHASLLNRMRGTPRALRLLSQLITGFPCQIVEGWQLGSGSGDSRERAHLRRLYGDLGEGITILVPSSASRQAVDRLRALLPDFVPLGVRYALVHLEDGAPMDSHCYLDENAVLTPQPHSELDGSETDEVMLE